MGIGLDEWTWARLGILPQGYGLVVRILKQMLH